jgi:hypothetical protein
VPATELVVSSMVVVVPVVVVGLTVVVVAPVVVVGLTVVVVAPVVVVGFTVVVVGLTVVVVPEVVADASCPTLTPASAITATAISQAAARLRIFLACLAIDLYLCSPRRPLTSCRLQDKPSSYSLRRGAWMAENPGPRVWEVALRLLTSRLETANDWLRSNLKAWGRGGQALQAAAARWWGDLLGRRQANVDSNAILRRSRPEERRRHLLRTRRRLPSDRPPTHGLPRWRGRRSTSAAAIWSARQCGAEPRCV